MPIMLHQAAPKRFFIFFIYIEGKIHTLQHIYVHMSDPYMIPERDVESSESSHKLNYYRQ